MQLMDYTETKVETQNSYSQQLLDKIKTRRARVGIVGLGYVGLPLAVEFARAGFSVTEIDIHARKVEAINSGCSYVQDVPTSTLAALVESGKLNATAVFPRVSRRW